MKRVIFIILLINVVSANCLGDVNLDNSIDNEDVIMMVQHILHMDTMDSVSLQNADMDGNSYVDIYDLSRVVDIIIYSLFEDCN